ncbi:MAG: polynucleotide kinase-phosphatase [Phycisphaerales bacterium]|jgi:polynucleotide kinase-phosphatase|nr:polynucleotide kinase-phosphatase [Phycisphaerales bacterium]
MMPYQQRSGFAIQLPELSLVVLAGPSGSGKSSFARKHFKPTEVLSSDYCRGLVSDDENNQAATHDAFDVLHYIAGKRLKNGLLTVIDATNVRPEDRRQYVQLAREHHCLPVAIVLNLPERLCQDRNVGRADRDFGPHVIRNQCMALRRGMGGRQGRGLQREGFRQVWVLESEGDVTAATVERTPLWNNKKHEHGPFDIIGDVHGCFDELVELIESLGYGIERRAGAPEGDWSLTPPALPHEGAPERRLLFLGDLVDRGPNSPAVLRLAMRAVREGRAMCVPGNHDIKLLRKLNGRNVQITHGLAETLEQLEGESPEFIEEIRKFIDSLVSHYVLDDGRLVVAHAGLKESMQGRGSGAVREFCLYGETTGETDEFGLPVRYNWAAEYRGGAMVVYGHTPVPEADWLNGTICIDTGCVFGGKLTALRYPERERVSVDAKAVYAEPVRPFLPDGSVAELTAQQQHDDMLHLADVVGKRIVDTRLQRNITIREENATAALEVMSRFAADPRWLIYLPPTMSPCETSERAGLLEHPAEAFDYYRSRGVAAVVCEEKHMGSRAVVVVCRNEDAARERFGVTTGEVGIVYTRTGRRFFSDEQLEAAFLDRLRASIEAAGLWEELGTSWMCLDCELMPWSAKAQGLLREQYAAVGSAARFTLAEAVPALGAAAERIGGDEIRDLLARYEARRASITKYTDAYRQYCWEVGSLEDYKLAPFHLLATERGVHTDRDHLWHMATLARLAGHDALLLATNHRMVDLTDEASSADAIAWWESMTARGGEGMVVKPREFIARGSLGLLQPAVKCRGPEYLRIIYGPEYLAPENLERLRRRGLKHKRSLALREFALGIESLERFVRREPLRRVHECVFGVLALESEPVDPRL